MFQDYCEIFCQAVDQLMEKRIEQLDFDKTITCTVVDASDASNGRYKVSMGSRTFEATSSLTNLEKEDSVYVTIMKNDFSLPKVIVGKAPKENAAEVKKYKSPLNQMVITTDQIFQGIEQKNSGIIANSITANDAILKYPNSDSQEVFDNLNGARILLKTFDEGTPINGYTRLGIRAEFKTLLQGAIDGDYGLLITIGSSEEIQGKKYSQVSRYHFRSSDMFGDIYNFNVYYPQEYMINIENLYNQIDYIAIDLIQDINHPFKKYGADNKEINYPEANYLNILVKNCTGYFGYDKEDFTGNGVVKLYTPNSLKYSKTDDETQRLRTMGLRWVYNLNNEYTFIDNLDKLDYKNFEICWYKYKRGAGAADLYSGLEWERKVQYEKKDAANEKISTVLSWDYSTQLYRLDDYLLQKLQKNLYGIIQGEIDINSNNTLVTSHFKDGRSINLNDIGYDSLNKRLMQFLKVEENEEEIEKWVDFTGDLETISFINSLSFEDILDNSSQVCKYKCIILIDDLIIQSDEILEFTNIDEVLSNEAVLDALSTLSISFEDGSNGNYYVYNPYWEVSDRSIAAEKRELRPLLNGTEITSMSYKTIWTVPTKQTMISVMNPNFSYQEVQNFQSWYNEILANTEETNDFCDLSIKQGYIVQNPMILNSEGQEIKYEDRKFYTIQSGDVVLKTSTTEKIYIKIKDETKSYTFYTTDTGLHTEEFKEITDINLNYQIGSHYSPAYSSNNIITCTVISEENDSVKYQKTVELSFGQQGSVGTQYTLVLDFEDHRQAMLWENDEQAAIIAQLYDGQNLLEENISYEWRWSVENAVSYSESLPEIKFVNANNEGQCTDDGARCLIQIKNAPENPPDRSSDISENEIDPTGNYYIISCSCEWQGYKLISYLPIPIVYCSHKDKIDPRVSFLYGPDTIIYSPSGMPEWFNAPYRLITNAALEVASTSDEGAISSSYELYGRMIANDDNYTIAKGETSKKTFVLNGNVLAPSILYEKDKFYGIKYTGQFIDSSDNTEGINIVWYQPLLIMQNTYFSTTINQWEGKKVQIGTTSVLTPLLIAGNKDNQNLFSGVALGEFDPDNTQSNISTGLYGINKGNVVYAFKDDGTGYIGGSKGRIQFDGNKCQLYSGSQLNTDGKYIPNFSGEDLEMLIDLNRNVDEDTAATAENVLGYITFGNNTLGTFELGSLKSKEFYPIYFKRDSYLTSLDISGHFTSNKITTINSFNVSPSSKIVFEGDKNYILRLNSSGKLGCYIQ